MNRNLKFYVESAKSPITNIPSPREFELPKDIQQEFTDMLNTVVRSQTSRENPSTETTFEIGKNYIVRPINHFIEEEKQSENDQNRSALVKFNVTLLLLYVVT